MAAGLEGVTVKRLNIMLLGFENYTEHFHPKRPAPDDKVHTYSFQ